MQILKLDKKDKKKSFYEATFETFSSDGWKDEGMTSVPQRSGPRVRWSTDGRPSKEVVVALFYSLL